MANAGINCLGNWQRGREGRRKEGKEDTRGGSLTHICRWSSQRPKEIASLKRHWNNEMAVTMGRWAGLISTAAPNKGL